MNLASNVYVRYLEHQVDTYSALFRSALHPPATIADQPASLEWFPETETDWTTCSDSYVNSPTTGCDQVKSVAEDLSNLQWKTVRDITGSSLFLGPGSAFSLSSRHPVPTEAEPDLDNSAESLADHFFIYSTGLDVVHHLKTQFLQYVNPYYKFVEDYTWEGIETISDAAPEVQLFYCSVLAMGACHSPMKNAHVIGETFYQHAESLIFKCCRRSPNTTLACGLSLLALRGLCLGLDTPAWMYLSRNTSPPGT